MAYAFTISRTPALNLAFLNEDVAAIVGMGYRGYAANPREVEFISDLPISDDARTAIARLVTGDTGLTVVANKAQIIANEVDTVDIVCTNPVIAADTDLAYTVTFSGTIDNVAYINGNYASGDAAVENGAVRLALSTDFVGSYVITLRRKNSSEFGRVSVQAVEAI